MKCIKESILSSTHTGGVEAICARLEQLIPDVKRDKDFWLDPNDNKVSLFVPYGTKIYMKTWDDIIKLYSITGKRFSIVVNGQQEYEKFRKCFDCSFNTYASASNFQSFLGDLPVIHIENCKVDTSQLTHYYSCKFVFKKCNINLMNGLNAHAITIEKDCE